MPHSLQSNAARSPLHDGRGQRSAAPVTERSALVVRKRLEPTAGNASTRASAACALSPSGSASGRVGSRARANSNVFCGISPST